MKVDFHSGVADKLGATCSFLRKAQASGATVVVCGDPGLLDRLDVALWTFDAVSFVAHVRVRRSVSPAALVRTQTWLVDDTASVPTARELLLNLGPEMAEGWEQFARVVEIVSGEADDVDAGRRRWRQYSACKAQWDFELVHHSRTVGT
ncbi:MAG TPA: DNA polymerase III subunit chi [Burkholderiaceae bacterium]